MDDEAHIKISKDGPYLVDGGVPLSVDSNGLTAISSATRSESS
jgi:hypothetical protein